MTHSSALSIAPIQGSVSAAEWQARVDLAACYRLCDRYGMADMIYTHITARVPDAPGQFLINPNGMLFQRDHRLLPAQGEHGRGDPLSPRPALWAASGGLHHPFGDLSRAAGRGGGDAHPHHRRHGSQRAEMGLLPLTQTATRFYGRTAYHDFRGPERDPAEREALAKSLGDLNYCILRNHGLLTVGESIAEEPSSRCGAWSVPARRSSPWPATPNWKCRARRSL